MTPTIADIQQIFYKFNELCFDGKLPLPRIRLSMAKNYLGQLRYKTKKDGKGNKVNYDFCLCISKLHEMDQEKLEDVVIHELIHLFIHYNNIQDTSAHGAVFRRMMEDINTRFHRHITISDRSGVTSTTNEQKLKLHLICVAALASGDTGILVCARTKAFEIYDKLPRLYDIRKFNWYYSTDPFFNRYPRSTTPKLYRADKEELTQHLSSATELIRVGNVIRPKKKEDKK